MEDERYGLDEVGGGHADLRRTEPNRESLAG
jgi:hypothetical protein